MLRLRSVSEMPIEPPSACTLRGHKVAYPTPLKAVLRTERAVFANLQACRTLQSTGIVWTVKADA